MITIEDVWRREAPHVLGALTSRYRDFAAAEDAAQEALIAALQQWPDDGVPNDPRGWLIRVASRRLVDAWRSDAARVRRQVTVALQEVARDATDADTDTGEDSDDSLRLLLLCAHPALTRASQVALTLRAVGGLTTAQIAAAFLVPEATMAQRISRAKTTLTQAGVWFDPPPADELPRRWAAVMDVLYLIFNEGYTATIGPALTSVDLSDEAIRLTRMLRALRPTDAELAGLLALMLLTDARRHARTDEAGNLVPLTHQDRSRWDVGRIAEGIALLEDALPHGPVGAFQLQAAIAAVHAEAPTAADTDWPQIAILYAALDRVAPSCVVTLNRAVAIAEVDGPGAGLALVEPLLDDRAMGRHHRTHAVHAHLLEQAGRTDQARKAYLRAAALTRSVPEQRYLNARATALTTIPSPTSTALTRPAPPRTTHPNRAAR